MKESTHHVDPLAPVIADEWFEKSTSPPPSSSTNKAPLDDNDDDVLTLHALAQRVQIGDLVFIRIPARPFREVASATGSWTNHVGIVLDASLDDPLIGESRFPWSGSTRLSRFVARSQSRGVAVCRLNRRLSTQQEKALVAAATRRSGIFYDTGFDLHSRRQFCSRYVREVVEESTGISLGRVENFKTLFSHRPEIDLGFWRLWYLGSIPWQRETVTPASLLQSVDLHPILGGTVKR